MQFYKDKSPCPEINQQRLNLIASKKYENIPMVFIARYPSYLIGENDPDHMDARGSNLLFILMIMPNITQRNRMISFQKNLTEVLCQTSKTNPVYIVQPIPEVGFNLPQRIIKNVFYKRNEKIFISHDAYLKRSGEIRQNYSGKCSAVSGQGPRPCITFM